MLTSKHNSLKEWCKADPKAVAYAKQHGMLPEICEMFGWEYIKQNQLNKTYWSLERCKEKSLNFNTIHELRKNFLSCYNKIKRNKWQSECFGHMMIRKPNGYWVKELCIEEAKKYKTQSSLNKFSPGSYDSILRNKWQGECFGHMKNKTNFWDFENCLSTALRFDKIMDLRKNKKGCYSKIIKNKWGDKCFAHMKKK